MIQLGSKGKDKISGVIGIVTGKVEYISGCNQVLVQPQTQDGTFKEALWFDVQRIEVLGDEIITLNNDNPGHDREAPKR